ncbi:MAG TPA: cupin domain-containing protein [Blastocatellia bacterium]|nr:cupin domain-containing protein [Blastocatellia bacterium]
MAIINIPDEKRTIEDPQAVTEYLSSIGIDYERWDTSRTVAANAPAEEILAAYSAEIEKLKTRGGYVTADVIDVNANTPGLDAMLAKFNREHWHDEDEVRFIIQGRGLFHIHPEAGSVVSIEVEAGDLIRVPRGTWHWFNLCESREIRAIRLFQDPAGWAPNYTESGVDGNYQPVCFGASYFPVRPVSSAETRN